MFNGDRTRCNCKKCGSNQGNYMNDGLCMDCSSGKTSFEYKDSYNHYPRLTKEQSIILSENLRIVNEDFVKAVAELREEYERNTKILLDSMK